MKTEDLEEVLACLEGGRTMFYYYPDRYAVYLLRRYLRNKGDALIRNLRNCEYARLLERPVVQDVIKRSGDGYLSIDDLDYLWPSETRPYVLTLGRWGHARDFVWAQTSRPGRNLVLQLNLSEFWAEKMQVLLDEELNQYSGMHHPLSVKRSATLAWARLDLELSTGIALIEEIQSDLVHELKWLLRHAKQAVAANQKVVTLGWYGNVAPAEELLAVTTHLLKEARLWHEAMLTAAMWFAFEELGMSKLYFHSFETGCVVKNLVGDKPPRSLYTQVPKKFCFQKTVVGPDFIVNDKKARRRLKKAKNPSWFVKAA